MVPQGPGYRFWTQLEYSFKSSKISPWSKILWSLPERDIFILIHPEKSSLNKRSEFFAKCRHKAEYKLSNFKTWRKYLVFLFSNYYVYICVSNPIMLCSLRSTWRVRHYVFHVLWNRPVVWIKLPSPLNRVTLFLAPKTKSQ